MSYPPPPPGGPTPPPPPGGYPPAQGPAPGPTPPPPPGGPPPGGYPPAQGPAPAGPPPGGYPPAQGPAPGTPPPPPGGYPPAQGPQTGPYPPAPGGPTPPPGGYGPTPPPGGFPPPGPAEKKSNLPLFLVLGVIAVLALAAIGFFTLSAVGGDEPKAGTQMREMVREETDAARARTALSTAVVDADPAVLAEVATETPETVADPTAVTLGEPATATFNDAGYAVFSFEAIASRAYTVVPDGDYSVGALPAEDGLGLGQAPAAVVDPATDGPHLVVVAGGEADAEVSVTVTEVEVIAVDPNAGEAIDGEITGPGSAVAYEHEAEAGSHFIIDIDDTDLAIAVTGPDGATVPTEPDIDLDKPRYVAEQAGTYTVTVSTGEGGETGTYSIEIFEVAEFYFFYDEVSVPGLTLERTTEQFQAPIDQAAQRAHFCLFLREGISMDLDIRVTSATLDMGIDVFDETDSGDLIARVNEFGPGENELWSVTAPQDVVRCFQLWAVDYTGGNFIISFTTEG